MLYCTRINCYIVTMTIHPTGWRPSLKRNGGPLHAQLVAAIEQAITTGALTHGERLPTHRALAHSLGVGIGTVTRAYLEAEQRGLLASHVGRGTFVASADEHASAANEPIDLARNLGPRGSIAAQRLREAMTRISKRADLADHMNYAPSEGWLAHRRAAAAWLNRTADVPQESWKRLVMTTGAQQAIFTVLHTICKPKDVVLAEAGTYVGARNAAELCGCRLEGVAMDGEGLVPEALDEAAAKTKARVLYTLPTFQNPTGRVMGKKRREQIAKVARTRNLTIIEDDIYAVYLTKRDVPTLMNLAPERTFYVSSVSKVLGPGLRTGFVIAPTDALFEALTCTARAICVSPPAFGSLIAVQWIEDGTADDIANEVRTEVVQRRKIATAVLGNQAEHGAPGSAHMWVPLAEAEAERLASAALREGVAVTPPCMPIVDFGLLSGVRLCLGAARGAAELERGLGIVAGLLRTEQVRRAPPARGNIV